MKFLVLSNTVVNLDQIILIRYNSEIKRASIWLTDGKNIEIIDPSEYNQLIQAIGMVPF